MTPRTGRAGFSLIEVLAVVLLTSIVIGVALDHYVDLSRASQRAMEHTRGIRRATAILDRIARDFESTVLVVKEPEMDPLDHPWIFLGESRRSDVGADHLKFVTRGHRPRRTAAHESDLEVVAYSLRRVEEVDFELMRWSSPRLPESLDREIPNDESQGAVLLAGDVASFGVQFIDELGGQTSSWDSSQLSESSELPLAVEIEVALLDPAGDPDAEPQPYSRRVILPVRPLEMQELLDPNSLVSGGEGSEADEEGEEGEEGEEDTTGRGHKRCAAGPCGNMTMCQAISCEAKIGIYGQGIDMLLEDAIENPRWFCVFYDDHPTLHYLIDNPACRR
ncbi:MAG: prepilin-type N-terminal cleavage/methylation domain-containing protein [Deltaproteobacteria bacterium]|nr:prepilin-type N-terminal cleavage/methylation domain-containing protein [Deltaproteobacteria bacterium]